MNNLRWSIATGILVAAIGVMAFFKYLDHYDLHNEWIIVHLGKETALVEYRVSLYNLRMLVSENDLTFEQAVQTKLSEQLAKHHRNPKNCNITELFGNLQTGVFLQARCKTFTGS